MEWNGTELIAGGMGGTVVRASSFSSSSSAIALGMSPRLSGKLLLPAKSSPPPLHQHHHSFSAIRSKNALAAVSPSLNPKPYHPSLQLALSSPSVSSSAAFGCGCVSAPPPPPPRPPRRLMSSRLAQSAACSSFCGFTRFENGRKRGAKCGGVSAVLSSKLWGWRGGGGGQAGSGRCMESEKNGQRIECYSSSSQTTAAAAAAGGDQPLSSSSVLPPTVPTVSKVKGLAISFCPRCGGATEEKIPLGEHEKRYVCTACGAVHYQNPKMVVGCLVEHEGKILLCRRSIEPSFGLWTLPAGYMEMGESAAEGAARETLEEACAQVEVLGPFAHLDIPLIGQSHIYFRAALKDPHIAPGPESIECALFNMDEIPFESLAFSSIQVALKMYIEDIKAGNMRVHHAVIDKRAGAGPSDLKGFVVRDVLSS